MILLNKFKENSKYSVLLFDSKVILSIKNKWKFSFVIFTHNFEISFETISSESKYKLSLQYNFIPFIEINKNKNKNFMFPFDIFLKSVISI